MEEGMEETKACLLGVFLAMMVGWQYVWGWMVG